MIKSSLADLAATLTTRGARRPPIIAEKKAVMTIGKVNRDTSCLHIIIMVQKCMNNEPRPIVIKIFLRMY